MNIMLKKILPLLPRAWVRQLRRWHAPRVAARFTDADWPYADAIRTCIPRGGTVIDAGANIGYLTARFSDYVGPEGRVLSFEPVPDTYDLLSRTVARLGLKNVTTYPVGLSSAPGSFEMEIPTDASGTENFYESRIVADASAPGVGRRVRIEVRTLDEVVDEAGLERVDFVKVDVEGHEWALLQGAEKLLTNHRPTWLVEINENPAHKESPARLLFDRMKKHGYSIKYWNQKQFELWTGSEISTDYLFCPDS